MSELEKRIANLSEAKRALLQHRLHGKRMGPEKSAAVARRSSEGLIPLSCAQERMWFLDQFEPDSIAYSLPFAIHLRGALNVPVLQQCLNEIVRRHEVLRTRIEMVESRPTQQIDASVLLEMPLVDLMSLPLRQREAEATRLCREEAQRPFDLKSDWMLRVRLFRLGPTDHVLFLNMHHIVSDGWSMGVLYSELKVLYQAFVEEKNSPLPPLEIQYADYAAWQRDWLQGEAYQKQLSYWLKQFETMPTPIDLPADRPRPTLQSYRGAMLRVEWPGQLAGALKDLGRAEGATFFMTLLASFQTLLHRYTGVEDVVVGSVIAGRDRTEVESLIGFFVNTLALRGDLSGNPTFRELLQRTRKMVLAAFAHQDLPFEKLVEVLKPQRDLSHSPLFQVLLVFQSAAAEPAPWEGVEVTARPIHTDTSKFDLTLSVREVGEALEVELEYSTDLFEAGTISRLLDHFRTLLEGIVAHPEKRLLDLPLLTEAERHQLLIGWNQTQRDYPRDQCIHELFEEQAARAPNAVAAIFKGDSLSYQELNQRADRLAQGLRALGVGPKSLVGLCIDRSFEMLIGVLGILKAGGSYWAVEENLPEERLQLMLAEARPAVLLYSRKSGKVPSHRSVAFIEDLLTSLPVEKSAAPSPVRASDPAYVSYTSGSTGQPKGVVVPHRGVVRLVRDADYVSLGSDETILHLSPLAFDASTFEIWGPLLNGGRIILMAPGLPTLADIGESIRLHGVTTAWLTAGLFHLMVDERLDDLKPLRQLLAGGDVLLPKQVRLAHRALPDCRIINAYGPTENTTFTCCHTVEDERDLVPSVPIGRPIANTQVYILDEARQPVPIGVAGELYTGGDGVACGYLHQPALTAEKFLPDPFSDRAGDTLYRTGDRARWRIDGTIEFLGRLDGQVKIRGFRVELGEIESVLNQYPGVQASVVVVREDTPGDKRLIAYVVSHRSPASNRQWREFLRVKLPDYMIPAAFVALEALPLNPNGKVDRKALPKPVDEMAHVDEMEAPTTPREIALAQIWREVLGLKSIGINDDFFELGGHSLLAVQLITKIKKSLSFNVTGPVLFQNPTVKQLAAVMDQESSPGEVAEWIWDDDDDALVTFHAKGSSPPLFFLHGDWTGGGFYCGKLSRQLGDNQPFHALAPYRSGAPTTLTIEEMAAHHVAIIQAHTPHGPYLIGGYCVGATVATEIARQLTEKGENVARLLLIDPALSNNRLLRESWPIINHVGEMLNWDLQTKINHFDRSFTALDRWLAKSPIHKLTSLRRRLGLIKAGSSSEVMPGPEGGDLDEDILKSLDFAVYVLAYRLHRIRPLAISTAIYLSEETSVSHQSAIDAREIFPLLTIETVPGNHRTCIIQHTSELVEKMKKTLGGVPGKPS